MRIITAKEIALMLGQRAESVAKYLLPNGKRLANEWCIGSIDGEEGKSLKICLAGDKAGLFCDFATGESGDLINLWALKRNLSLSEAIKEAKQWLGIASVSFEAYKAKKFNRPVFVGSLKLESLSPVRNYLIQERKLTEQTLEIFKIGEKEREIIFPYFRDNELLQIKFLSLDRPNGKKQIRVEKDCEPCLFGWQTIPKLTREIAITEGECDAMTLYQYGIPALSVPFGGGKGAKHQWIEYEFNRLVVFDKIYLCFDNDSEGKAAIAQLVNRLGNYRCYIVELPHKDANDCLKAGMTSEEIKTCFEDAISLDPEELKLAKSFVREVIDEFNQQTFENGINPPFEKAKGKIIFRPDELSIWTGINGHGKSQFLGQIILDSIKQSARVCIASLELKPRRLLARLTRQAGGLSNPTNGYIEAIHEWYGDRLWIFNLVGNAKSERLLEVFIYAHQRYGVDTFVIDSFMKLDIAEDDYKAQKIFLEKLCDFKNKYNCHVHLIVHPRKGVDEAKFPNKLDAKGTGAITDLADNCFTVWRNKAKQDAINKILVQDQKTDNELLNQPDCLWICDKQRNGEWEGKIGLWFHADSFQYLNHSTQRPIQYVQYSNPVNFNQGNL